MPAGRDQDDSARDDQARPGLIERLKGAVLKPVVDDPASDRPDPEAPLPVDELEVAVRRANDKERLVGLIAAPLAAAISILVISALVANNPAAYFKNGQPNHAHVNVSLYHELELVLLGMSILILVAALWRKRLFMGILLAIFGLGIFNLHYWGFGFPFVLAGAWMLVRAYRLQRQLKEQTADDGVSGTTKSASRPRPNKRYTPPTS